MKIHVTTFGCLVLALLLVSASAADPKADKEAPIHEISLDVQALRAFFSLRLTDEQLKRIAKFAKETAEPARKRTPPKVSNEYRKALADLRDTLIAANDEDKISDLEDELEKLMDKEKLELDDAYDITKAARKRTPDVIMNLTVTQLAGYYSAVADDVQEPAEELTKALSEVRGLEKKEWTNKRDEIADEVAWAVAGLDAAKSEKMNDKIVALLNKAHTLSDDEFKAKKADMEKEAKALVGEVGPDMLLRHHVERTVADMLSNPRLEAVLKARLK